MNKKKVGIVTWHYYNNFGSALQAYALQQSVIALGYDCNIINYRDDKFGKYSGLKNRLMEALDKSRTLSNFKFPFVTFQFKYLKQTTIIRKIGKLQEISKKYEVVICGSDQIWAPNVFNPVYMLNFVPEGVRKISYAASIGLNNIPDELVVIYQKLLSDFHSVSVREKAGGQLLKDKCSIEADIVLDPTLLIDISHWNELESDFNTHEKYVFCYFLNENHRYREVVKRFSKEKGVKIIGHSANGGDAKWMNLVDRIGPNEFLSLIHHAEAVFTDSYHGTIFSLLYHKPFLTFERFKESDKECQNSRIHQLNDYFNITNRIVQAEHCGTAEIPYYDYDMFESKLHDLRRIAIEYLCEALEG